MYELLKLGFIDIFGYLETRNYDLMTFRILYFHLHKKLTIFQMLTILFITRILPGSHMTLFCVQIY